MQGLGMVKDELKAYSNAAKGRGHHIKLWCLDSHTRLGIVDYSHELCPNTLSHIVVSLTNFTWKQWFG